ncbi:MAG: hypothetical protein ABIG03_02160 [Candidatus Eisenbacteria bacterium]
MSWNRTASISWTFLTVALLIPGVPLRAAGAPGIESIGETVTRLESAMATGAGDMTLEKFGDELKDVRKDVADHLEGNPDDVQALILSVRVAVMEEILEPVVFSPTDDERLASPYAREHADLDHALSLDPENADAHYWKARLYGLQVPTMSASGRYVMEAVDLEGAIEHAGIAVERSPETLQYREALALYLVDAERRDEAVLVMSAEGADESLITKLLADMESVPLPDSALYLKLDSAWFADMNAGGVENYPPLRVKAFALPMTPLDLESFYGELWDGFALLRKDGSEPGGVQFLAFAENGFEPASTFERFQDEGAEGHGIVLVVRTVTEPTPDDLRESTAGQPLPEGFGPPLTYMYVIDVRPTE